ncbi:hypothetical protein OJF2_74810 [Aquisphaera giovannonii]|uniref:DUF6985 domain-containing protein n=1 Tax=Aquisphaera giovannonii TaxID=406548 RepID=A0A5B9WFV3_9BACT|nr:hypothetical protein [Aquisphaera giovannonii]QEH38871.1 hypothetical protein OJF2_74810 [Aquisphaera giovannonii]
MNQETLDQAPFPVLKWDHYGWAGEVVLPSWAGFQARRDAYGGGSVGRPPDGTARLSIASLDSDARAHPTAEQVAAFRHLMDNEAEVADAVARALVEYCPGEAYNGDDDELMDVSEADDLRPLIGLSEVHVLDVFRDGFACVGFQFGCVWHEEHGAGVMTHRGRVIATGQADCSFLEWIAEQGLDRRRG